VCFYLTNLLTLPKFTFIFRLAYTFFCSSFKDCPETKNFKMLENSYFSVLYYFQVITVKLL